jgi:hypothetical protein
MLRRVVLTRAALRKIPEDTILHSHRRETLKSYMWFVSRLLHDTAIAETRCRVEVSWGDFAHPVFCASLRKQYNYVTLFFVTLY